MAVVAGVDVGKASLETSVAEGPVVRFGNTAADLTRLLKHLRALDVTVAVCESTGGYERLLVDRLRKTEIAMYVAHPNRVRAFARACGYEAKTDPRDAQVLSRYGKVFPDAETPARELEPEREELQDLLRRRRQLVDQRVQESGRLDKGVTAYAAKSTKRHISWLEKEIARLDKEYQAALQRSAPMAQRAALYCTWSRSADRGGPGCASARTRTARRQGPHLPGGLGSLVEGQWTEARQTRHQGRPRPGAAGPIHMCVGGDSPQ